MFEQMEEAMRNKVCYSILLVALLLISPFGRWNLHAQSAASQLTFHFENFDLPGGEMGSNVQAIAQDSFGFMWFGSQYGLHRWDGYQFKTYLNNTEDPSSMEWMPGMSGYLRLQPFPKQDL